MTTELWILLFVAVALPVLATLAAGLYGRQVGNRALLTNREGLIEPSGAALRARRAHLNLLENALSFAAVVLIAHQLGISNSWTVAGALVFLAARVVHYLAYLTGVTNGIRSLAYHVGTLGTLLIAVQILIAGL